MPADGPPLIDRKGNVIRDFRKYSHLPPDTPDAEVAALVAEYWAGVGGAEGGEYLARKALLDEKLERETARRVRLGVLELEYQVWMVQARMRCCAGDCVRDMQARLNTTVITQNRAEDRAAVQARHPLLLEHGRETVGFAVRLPCGPEGGGAGCPTHTAVRFAMGYTRVVYGDHGPYVEFLPEHLALAVLAKKEAKTNPMRYYDEYQVRGADGAPGGPLFYAQLRDVGSKKNPPKDNNPRAARNSRPEGYADYIVGRWYVSAYAEELVVEAAE